MKRRCPEQYRRRGIELSLSRAEGHGIPCPYNGYLLPTLSPLLFQLCVDGDLGLEELRYGASGFCRFHRRVELGFVCAGNFGDEIEVAFGDAEAVANFVERDRSLGFELFGLESRATQ